MTGNVFSQSLRYSFTQRGMRVHLIKADKEDDLFDAYESLRSNFSTLPHTAFHMIKSNGAASQPKTAVVILSTRSFVASDPLFNDARSIALNGSGDEIIDLRQMNVLPSTSMMGA